MKSVFEQMLFKYNKSVERDRLFHEIYYILGFSGKKGFIWLDSIL